MIFKAYVLHATFNHADDGFSCKNHIRADKWFKTLRRFIITIIINITNLLCRCMYVIQADSSYFTWDLLLWSPAAINPWEMCRGSWVTNNVYCIEFVLTFLKNLKRLTVEHSTQSMYDLHVYWTVVNVTNVLKTFWTI